MDALRADLWRKIRAFEFDKPGDSLTFTRRLARENGWSIGYARRVLDEYRRFLFLAMAAGHEATPSEHVDEAWHMHLVYTKSYWEDLCRNVLGRPLHHNPTRGGPAENERHRAQYERTLASYRAHFGEAAPDDIWPPVDVQFGANPGHLRVCQTRNWVVPKPRLWPARRRAAGRVLTTGIAPLLVGFVNPFNMTGPEFLVLYGILTAMVLVAAVLLRSWLRSDESASHLEHRDSVDLGPIEVGCLGRGVAGVLQSCLAGLVADGRIKILETPANKIGPITLGAATYKLRATVAPQSAATELERVMLSAADVHNGADAAEILQVAKPIAETVESKLQWQGLLETEDSFGPARWWPLMLFAGLAALGVIKLIVGLSRGKPVTFLLIWLIVLAFVAVWFAVKPRRTKRGDRVFQELQSKYENLKTLDFAQSGGFAAGDMMLVTALFGLAATTNPDVKLLQGALKPVPSSDGGLGGSSGSCGSGCGGGGGCGGGCGGCGGD